MTATPPSAWIVRFAGLIAPGAPVLDLACGAGRHVRLMLARGHPVTAVDRDLSGLADIEDRQLTRIAADLEDGGAWPPGAARFAGIIVTNYLYRPLFPKLRAALDRPGVLIYETFAEGNQRFGKPSNPAYLLKHGELLEVTKGLTVLAYEDLTVAWPRPAAVQRICALLGGAV